MNHQEENLNLQENETQEKIQDELVQLYNYPSIGKLFSDNESSNLQNLRTKLNSTRERLDMIVRRGSNEEAHKATKALEAVSITLNFLENLEDKRSQN